MPVRREGPGARIVAAVRPPVIASFLCRGPVLRWRRSRLQDSTIPIFFFRVSARARPERQRSLRRRDQPWSLVFYEAPHRVVRCRKIWRILGPRQVVIAREPTKVFETIASLPLLGQPIGCARTATGSGEFVLVVSGRSRFARRRRASGCSACCSTTACRWSGSQTRRRDHRFRPQGALRRALALRALNSDPAARVVA